MQVEVADVGADAPQVRAAGRGEPDLGVHVRPVHVHQPAAVVDDLARLADGVLEHAVGRRVGDHQASELVAAVVGPGPQVVEVDVAVGLALHGHDRHPGDDR